MQASSAQFFAVVLCHHDLPTNLIFGVIYFDVELGAKSKFSQLASSREHWRSNVDSYALKESMP